MVLSAERELKKALYPFYLIYLRKSRQDDPRETVAEVLAKHETLLQDYAVRELGGRIPEGNIYREVVSGESIDDRREMLQLLSRIEDPSILGVLVVEPSRLSRGDLLDCGRLVNDLRYTKTVVLTPYMSYDLENKMERKFFQDELLRGSDYLEYTKEILMRGRIAAVKRGCYIGNSAPFGYKKVKIGRDHTLEIVPEEAEVIRLIFDLFVNEGVTRGRIALRLTEMGIPAPKGGAWKKDTVRHIVRNRHYAGFVVFNKIKETVVMEHGERVVKRLAQPEDQVIVAPGLHEAIVDESVFEAAQAIVARNPRHRHTYKLKNPLSTILVCSACGGSMIQHPYKKAEDRYECKTRPRCFKSVKVSEVYSAVISALESSELPALRLKVKNGDGQALKIQQAQLAKLEALWADLEAQEEKQFDLLETGVYSDVVFERRNAALREKMEECQKAIYTCRATMPRDVNYSERVETLERAIALFKTGDADPEELNHLLRAVVDRIEYTGVASDRLNRTRNVRGYNPFSLAVFLHL